MDTSVWVDSFNGHPSSQGEALAQLLRDEIEGLTCGVILAAFFQGIRRRFPPLKEELGQERDAAVGVWLGAVRNNVLMTKYSKFQLSPVMGLNYVLMWYFDLYICE